MLSRRLRECNRNQRRCVYYHLNLARNSQIVVPENLFRSAVVDDWKGGDTCAKGIHFQAIEGPSRLLNLVFQSGHYGVAESYTHPFADLLGQTMGGGILDIECAPLRRSCFSLRHDFYCK